MTPAHRVLRLDGHEAERKHVAVAAGVALQHSIAQWAVLVQRHLPASGLDLRQPPSNSLAARDCGTVVTVYTSRSHAMADVSGC